LSLRLLRLKVKPSDNALLRNAEVRLFEFPGDSRTVLVRVLRAEEIKAVEKLRETSARVDEERRLNDERARSLKRDELNLIFFHSGARPSCRSSRLGLERGLGSLSPCSAEPSSLREGPASRVF